MCLLNVAAAGVDNKGRWLTGPRLALLMAEGMGDDDALLWRGKMEELVLALVYVLDTS